MKMYAEYTTENLKRKLRLLKSDLADTNNTKLLEKYPHLDNQDHRDYLKKEIDYINKIINNRKQ